MIRKAELADVPGIVAMGRDFHAMAPHNPMGEYDFEATCRMVRFLVENPAGLVLTNGEGMIGGMMSPVYFNPTKLMMDEAFWWAKKGGRDLLKAFCAEAKAMGADFVCLSTLENDKQPVIDRVVTHIGFRPLERRYLKDLA